MTSAMSRCSLLYITEALFKENFTPSVNSMLCGFREVSLFVKTTCIHLKQATYPVTYNLQQASYPVRLKSVSDPFKDIRNETIYQCEYFNDFFLNICRTSVSCR